jgi:hypothetical protein
MSCPSATTVPDVGFTMPQMTPMSVVLPAPFGPRSAKISPRRISSDTFFSASKPDAYVFESFSTKMIVGVRVESFIVRVRPANRATTAAAPQSVSSRQRLTRVSTNVSGP